MPPVLPGLSPEPEQKLPPDFRSQRPEGTLHLAFLSQNAKSPISKRPDSDCRLAEVLEEIGVSSKEDTRRILQGHRSLGDFSAVSADHDLQQLSDCDDGEEAALSLSPLLFTIFAFIL